MCFVNSEGSGSAESFLTSPERGFQRTRWSQLSSACPEYEGEDKVREQAEVGKCTPGTRHSVGGQMQSHRCMKGAEQSGLPVLGTSGGIGRLLNIRPKRAMGGTPVTRAIGSHQKWCC